MTTKQSTDAAIKWVQGHHYFLSNTEWVGIYRALLKEVQEKRLKNKPI